MKFQLPWAKRQHHHLDPALLKYTTCSKCRHLLLDGHVENKRVEVIDRSKGATLSWTETYGKSCAPEYDRKEIGIDGEIRFYIERTKGCFVNY